MSWLRIFITGILWLISLQMGVAQELDTTRGPLRFVKLRSGPSLMYQKDYRSELVHFNLSFKIPVTSQKELIPGALDLLLSYCYDDKALHFLSPKGLPVYEGGHTVSPTKASVYGAYLSSDGIKVLNSYLNVYLNPVWDEKRFIEERDRFVKRQNLLHQEKTSSGHLKDQILGAWLPSGGYDTPRAAVAKISQLTLKDMKDLHARVFVPLNLSMAVVGAEELKPLVSSLDELFSKLKNSLPELPELKFVHPEKPQRTFFDVKSSLASLSFRGPKLDSEDMVLFKQIVHILRSGLGGIFFKTLENREGLVDFDVEVFDVGDECMLNIHFRDTKNRPQEVAQSLLEVLRLFANRPLSVSELSSMKKRSQNHMLRSLSSRMELLELFACMALNQYRLLTIEEYVQYLNGITSSKIQEMFSEYLAPEKAHFTSMEPESNQIKSAAAKFSEEWRSAKIHLEFDANQDMFGVGFVFRLPQHKNPAIPMLANRLLNMTAMRLLNSEASERLNAIDAQWKMWDMRGFYAGEVSVPRGNLEELLKTLPHVLFDRRLTRADFDLVLENWHQKYKRLNVDPRNMQYFYREVAPSLPAWYQDILDPKLVSSVQFEEMEKYLSEALQPHNLDIGITGDLKDGFYESDLKPVLENHRKWGAIIPRPVVQQDPEKLVPVSKTVKSDTDEFVYYQADVYKSSDLSVKEQAAMILIALKFFQIMLFGDEPKGKPEGVDGVNISFTSMPYPVFWAQVSGKQQGKDKAREFLREAMLEAASFQDHGLEFDAFRRMIIYGQDTESLNRGLRALNMGLYSVFDMSSTMADELVQAIKDLKPQDVQEVLKKRVLGQLQLMVLPKQ